MPKGTLGIIGVSVSASDPQNVYAIVEANDGGVFRSRDGGETWTKTSDSRDLRQRAWYYSRIYADPKDEDSVYVVNVRFHKSKDGGKTWAAIGKKPVEHLLDAAVSPGHQLMVRQRDLLASDGGDIAAGREGLALRPPDDRPHVRARRELAEDLEQPKVHLVVEGVVLLGVVVGDDGDRTVDLQADLVGHDQLPRRGRVGTNR